MEALAAVGLVANIAQLVDTAGKAFTSKSLNNTAIPAKTLQEELDALRKPPGSGVRATIKKAWLKKQKQKAIGKLKFAETLGTFDAKQEGQSKQLGQQLSQLSSDLKACQLGFAGQLSSEIDRYITASEAQHEVTRDHVRTHITELNEQRRQQQHDQQQHDQFLRSLWFEEINTRMNDIADSHSQTLHWMFEDNATRPWDSFCSWLQGNDRLYWINGKPGSGKSTLMKFLISSPRTQELLAQWSLGKSPLIVEFYFWLSGSELQRSFKGLLCSIIYKLVDADKQLVTKLLRRNAGLLSKRITGDWSKQELQRVLTQTINMLDRPLCIFLDGLDEFDQKVDIDQLLNLVEASFESAMIKFCISSRPENYITKRLGRYKQLRLQDLTARDIDVFIRTKLETTRTQCPPSSIDDEYLERIIHTIADKADGVFLWVYYALSSLVRGMRNEDDFGVVLGRIKELPNGMHQLYLEMWTRLNEDQQHYQEEAATYFSYAAASFELNVNDPLSLFEMLAVLNPRLQRIILDDLNPQDPSDLARECEKLKTRIIIRSAGLLELSLEDERDTDVDEPDTDEDEAGTDGDEPNTDEDEPNTDEDEAGTDGDEPNTDEDEADSDEDGTDRDGCSLSTGNSQPTVAMDDYEALTQSLSNQSRESLCQFASQSATEPLSSRSPPNDIPHRAVTHSNHTLAVHHRTRLKYLHRTARDFLLNTEDGRRLSGKPKDSPRTRSINIVRARMSALAQGLSEFHKEIISGLIYEIKRLFHELDPKERYETESLILLRRLCQSLSIRGDPQHHIGHTTFWYYTNLGFEAMAAMYGCAEYVQNFVQSRASRPDIGKEPPTRVPLIGMRTEQENSVNFFSLHVNAPCVCPSEDDSLYLGEALDRMLFSSSVPASFLRAFFQGFNARLYEVSERSEHKQLDVWKHEYIEAVDKDGELARDCDLDVESLGDKWYV
ncbi:MAG: hypothetical protein LQ349_002726 [Xanthoria aureola]|nr:MAG: hypothetical protein LQ349_002726 [Xanthoria aureola]